MKTYTVTFNEELNNQDLFVPSHIEFEHEYVSEYEARYTVSEEQASAFQWHLDQSLVVSEYDIVEE